MNKKLPFRTRVAKVGVTITAYLQQLRVRARRATLTVTSLTPYQHRQDPYS